jgi:dihydropteroate synthase
MFTLDCKGRLLKLDHPVVMGIINITPDSFYSGSRQQDIDVMLKKAEQMLRDGATILDIGGQSTRPGSKKIRADEELERIVEPIRAARQYFPEAFISIDTFYSRVAAEAVAAGADIINDISAGSMDAGMTETAALLKVPYVLMHMKGNPQTMQQRPEYSHAADEVFDFLKQKKEELSSAGIKDIIIDPGFGFGKTIRHNFELLHVLALFRQLDSPLLVGLSRKSTIYKTLGVTADEALNGTTVLNTIALMNGASILRVHDVKEAKEAITLFKEYNAAANK